MTRHVTGFLWRFTVFRELCLFLVGKGFAVSWIVAETPLGIAMHALALREGDLAKAALWSKSARETP